MALSSMPQSWADAIAAEIQASRQSMHLLEDSGLDLDCDTSRTGVSASACCDSSASVCEPAAKPDVVEHRPAVWWARILNTAAEELGYPCAASQPTPIRVVSACSGCSPESFVLKAGVFRAVTVYSVEYAYIKL